VYGHIANVFAAVRAEQALVDARATKLGPLFAEAECTPRAPTPRVQPRLDTVLGRLVHQLRPGRLKRAQDAADLRPIRGHEGTALPS
jgi:hypothetical protein